MSRNGITYLDVARCAEELSASNEDPTIERIRIRECELTQALQQLKMENESLRQQKTELQQSHDQLQSAQDNLQVQLQQMALHNEKNLTDLMEVKAALAKAATSAQHWQIQHDNMAIKWEEQTKITVELKTQNAISAQQMVTMKTELNNIAEQNKVLAHDKWVLGQEKAQLAGQVKQLQSILTNEHRKST